MRTSRGGACHVVMLLAFLYQLAVVGGGKFLPKKFKKLEKGLTAIGITEDQLEGIDFLLKRECKDMYLSFLTGGKERKKAKSLFKRCAGLANQSTVCRKFYD
jgi:hypothetical protein